MTQEAVTSAPAARQRPAGWVSGRRARVLLCASGVSFMIMLDSNIVAVSLPSIARDLNATFADIEWVVSAYVLTFAAFLMPSGAADERTHGDGDADDRAPKSERLGPLRAAKLMPQHRERSAELNRRAHALQRSRRVEDQRGWREAAQERRQSEYGEADDQHAPAPEPIRKRAHHFRIWLALGLPGEYSRRRGAHLARD